MIRQLRSRKNTGQSLFLWDADRGFLPGAYSTGPQGCQGIAYGGLDSLVALCFEVAKESQGQFLAFCRSEEATSVTINPTRFVIEPKIQL